MPGKTGIKNNAESINERIKQIRLTLKLSQAKFCHGIPLTNGHYAEIESGNRKVNQRTIKLIAASYGVSERFLNTGEGHMFDTTPDPRLVELISLFNSLPTNFQDYILREIKELKKLHNS